MCMFKIDELSDVELEEYVKENIGHTEEYQLSLKKNEIIRNLNRIQSILHSTEDDIKLMKTSVMNEDYERAAVFASSAYKKSKKCSNSICKSKEELGVEEKYNSGLGDSDYTIIGDRRGDILHIILPELLPDKVQQGEQSRYEEINHTFIPAFKRFFAEGRFPVYEKKAVLCFINIYESERQLKDHDNFEIKQVIDILSAFILTDDNPKWCSHYMDYKMGKAGEKCHTEIYIVPQSQFRDFFNL